ncbi:ACT domain-containing protein [Sediminibacillus massiliensis]|uniref:ACT domain-containing protein n=1 Tax=Sediminibacillus massiliensis TaxID=1926277 RepID=UPI0009888911|nr:ACT domain-containing protein [Sediminibacillus massiliensis]
MQLNVLPKQLAVIKIAINEKIPENIFEEREFLSITYTDEEISIICPEKNIPLDLSAQVEKGWSAFKVAGELDFSLTGILVSLAAPLAEASISIFALSTYNTDYLLVKTDNLERAIHILRSEGFKVE